MMGAKASDKVILISFAPNHASAVSRVRDVANGNFKLEVYETTTDKITESLAARIFSTRYPRMFWHLLRSDADVFWPWGLDACLVVTLVAILRPEKLLLWDITDINSKMLKPGPLPALLRIVERMLLKRANALLISSPTFYDRYFKGKIAQDKVTIIENLLPGPPPAGATLPLPPLPPCKIVYSGIIRSVEVLKMVAAVAGRMSQDAEFHIHGYLDRAVQEEVLSDLLAEYSNVYYHGRFVPDQLAEIFERSHLSWGFVDPGANVNEQWLLTNRIYNGVCFGRPVLATAGTTSGDLVVERKIGIACALDADKIVEVIRSLTANNAEKYHQLRLGMPPPKTAYLDGNYARLIDKLLSSRNDRKLRSDLSVSQ